MAFLLILGLAVGIFTALALVLVGLVEMPWPVLLVGLIGVIYGFQRLMAAQVQGWQTDNWLTTTTPSPTAESKVNPKVNQTVYRGVRTNPGPASQVPSPEIAGSSTDPASASVSSPQTTHTETHLKAKDIVYRGVKITSHKPPQGPGPAAKGPDQDMVYRGIRYGDKGDSSGRVDYPDAKS
jgi:xanthosine utilization system XapX-like protein